MRKLGMLLAVFFLLVVAGNALAQDDSLVKKFYGLIPAERLNQTPTKYVTVPTGAKLDPGLLGAFYGEGEVRNQHALIIKALPEGQVWVLWGWYTQSSNNIVELSGTVNKDGTAISAGKSRIWIGGSVVKIQCAAGYITKLRSVPIPLGPAAIAAPAPAVAEGGK